MKENLNLNMQLNWLLHLKNQNLKKSF